MKNFTGSFVLVLEGLKQCAIIFRFPGVEGKEMMIPHGAVTVSCPRGNGCHLYALLVQGIL